MRLEDFAYASTADYYQLKDLGEPDGGSEINLFSPLYPDSSHLQRALGVFFLLCFLLFLLWKSWDWTVCRESL